MSYTTRFTRLIVMLPSPIAEAFAAALVELGAGAVEQREPSEVELGAGAVEQREPSEAEDHAPSEPEEHAPSEPGEANLVELVLTLPEDADVEAWQSLVQSLYRAFAEQLGLDAAAILIRTDDCAFDYHAAWLERLVPQRLTDKLVFVPTHCRGRALGDTTALYFEPHPSFGDGSHPTTRLAAAAVERACEQRPGASVLDVGTGNGVLSFVAVVSGAVRAHGLDLDPEAIAAARHNAKLNELEANCDFEATELVGVHERFDLVVANLEPRTQVELLEAMVLRVKSGGTLVLTGFLAEQAEGITQPLVGLGFQRSHADSAEGYALEIWQAGAGVA